MHLDDDHAALLGATPRAVRLSEETAVRCEPLGRGDTELLAVMPAEEGVDLLGWVTGHRDWIERRLLPGGALLFRGFAVGSAGRFEELARAICPELREYSERSTPRSAVEGRVYTSTEYPADQRIPLHNELSYTDRWPARIWFYCSIPAERGGCTPIADSRRVFARIDPAVRQRFLDRGVMYVRNYGEGLGLSWQEVFQTSSSMVVEAYCKEAGLEVEWKGDGQLRTRARRQATVAHPRTGEMVWFNQAHLHHVSALPGEVREALLAVVGEEDLPFQTFYGDGTPIGAAEIEEIERAYSETLTTFDWQGEDILMLDNVLVAHGREPYGGPRRIVVTMA